MTTPLDPTGRIFVPGSRADRYIRIAAIVSLCLFVLTIGLTAVAIYKGPSCGPVVVVLALLWAIGAPVWFWFEYFFLYRRDGLPGTFDLYKHGHQVSLAIWAGLSLSLGALASSDIFKVSSSTAAPSAIQQPVAPPQPASTGAK